MTEGGAVRGLDGKPIPAGHGDSEGEYQAAVEGVALFDRSFRHLVRVSGRAPTQMLTGLATGTMPPDPEALTPERGGLEQPEPSEPEILRGRMPYSLILTPKGRIVTDLRIGRLEPDDGGALFLDLPPAGVELARAHMAKYLPPRFAKLEPFEEPPGLLTAVGPGAAELLRKQILGAGGPSPGDLAEGDEFVKVDGSELGVRIIRCGDVGPDAFDIVAARETLDSIRSRLLASDARPAGTAVWDVLRIEKGRPEFGAEIEDTTLPPEAGLDRCAIDHVKGCYTGQEVIVRIRDRGKVNRLLRGLLLDGLDPPEPGTPLFHPDRDGPSGEIRSAVRSPAFGQSIALGYVRREVEAPGEVHVGGPDGPPAGVRALTHEGWQEAG